MDFITIKGVAEKKKIDEWYNTIVKWNELNVQ